ncbi:hypothetical protein TrCOL_g11177 [Triparma columacea]|uniref:Gamma-glutamyltransferase n=1 Tax=Triparma columacea TaxID=722753 RepID=A0A9W7LDW2_9STRA|nr:hypothetical protein TrCOL_g11177 [Triparma columacea]
MLLLGTALGVAMGSALYPSPPPSSPPSSQPDISSLKEQSYLPPDKYKGVVAADDGLCSDLGANLMKTTSANAIDAAVATALCLGVVNPGSSGIGGGCFILFHDSSTSSTSFIDSREFAPAAASSTMYDNLPPTSSTDGPYAAAVPAELKGLEKMHQLHGNIPWADVVSPARDLARNGFPTSPYLAHLASDHWEKISMNAALKNLLSSPSTPNNPIKAGEIFKNSKLAETFDVIMEHGSDALYNGPIGEALVADLTEGGGIITTDDLASYSVTVREPVSTTINGFTITGAPPPSSGGATVLAILRFVSGFPTPFAADLDTLSQHRLSEGMKHAFAMRMSLADPAFYPDVGTVVEDMVSSSFIDDLRESKYSDNDIQTITDYGGSWSLLNVTSSDPPNRHLRGFQYLEDHGTTHLSVVDADLNAVAITSTVNTEFGSGFLSPSTGILLNNQMDDFSSAGRANYFGLAPSPRNYPEPRKRPLSSMSPTIVFDSLGKVRMVLGASGGPKIITATTQMILNHLFAGLNLFSANSRPRIHDQLLYHDQETCTYSKEELLSGVVLELSDETKASLESRNHPMLGIDYLGTCQAISITSENLISAVSDVRKDGSPSGWL